MEMETLAAKLGTTTHLSPLLHKARRLGLGPRELEILAVHRRCVHYSDGSEPAEPLATEEEFSNEDLALPHPTRFVAMTGFTRRGPGLVVEWQRPQRHRAKSRND